MNAPLRRVGVVVMVLFGLLFANLNWVQAYKADEYRTSDVQRPGPGRRVRARSAARSSMAGGSRSPEQGDRRTR